MFGDLLYILLINLVTLASHILKGFSGFGAGLFLSAFLNIWIPVKEVAPLVALVSLSGSGLMAFTYVRRSLSIEHFPLALSAAVGVVLGAHALVVLPEELLKRALGVLTLGLIGLILIRPTPADVAQPRYTGRELLWLCFLSSVQGALIGALGAAVFPLTVYLLLRLSLREMRGLLTTFFIATSLVQLFSYGALGLITPRVLALWLALLPGLGLGLYLGDLVGRKVRPAVLGRVVSLVLLWPAFRLLVGPW